MHRLSKMLEPRSIALVGASERSAWSKLIFKNYADLRFDGRLFAINREGVAVGGTPGYKSCVAIGEKVDSAFIFVPQHAVLAALEDAAAAGIQNVVILTSGYAETGAEGIQLQDELIRRADELDVLVWGPNSLGFNNFAQRVSASVIAMSNPILFPRIAIVSQSGATARQLDNFAHSQNIGTSIVAATGNEAQITLSHVVDYLVDHEPTKAIAIFAESIRDPELFAAATKRALERKKPVVILKIGRSALSKQVAMAHTGSLVGDDEVFSAICERFGIIRVHTPEDLITVAGLLAATGPLHTPGLGYISMSGGSCTLVADGAEAASITLPAHEARILPQMTAILSNFASSLNPLDVTGGALDQPDVFERVISLVGSQEKIGIVAVGFDVPVAAGTGQLPIMAAIGRAASTSQKPVIMVSTCPTALTAVSREIIASNKLPFVLTGVSRMLLAIEKAAWWSEKAQRAPRAATSEPLGAGMANLLSTEREALDFLASHGIPVVPGPIARSREDVVRIASNADGPLVLKILSSDIAHKTEVGGVKLNIAPADVLTAYDAIFASVKAKRPHARLDGIIVSPMRSAGIELIVGVKHDPVWGAVIAVGLGGILVEVLADVVIAPLPLDEDDVKSMLGRLRGAKLLAGFRGRPAADIAELARIVVRIGEAARALGPDLESLEINPLMVNGQQIEALDALVNWKTASTVSV